MTDEARETGGLDRARRPDPVRPGWGRGSHRTLEQTSDRSHASGHERTTYAALDLGTNNCRLLIAQPSGDSFHVIDAFSRIIRLGEGILASGRISDAATERAVDALSVCRDKIRRRRATRSRLIATEACRRAENGDAFLSRISHEVGIDLEIVDRETEAGLAATGCTPLVDPQAKGAILFDIGGGSSEIVLLGRGASAASGPPPPEIVCWDSMPTGVVTLAERYGGKTVTPQTYETMVAEVSQYVDRFAIKSGLRDITGLHLLGTSGTVTTIAGVHLGLRRYDRRYVDGCWMTAEQVTDVSARLLAMTYEERAANNCIGHERADLVLAGCAILEAIRRAFPCPRLRVADRGLREGILVQLMRSDGVWDHSGGRDGR